LAAKIRRLGSRFPRAEGLEAQPLTRRRLLVICLSVFFVATGVRLLQWQNNWHTIDKTMWRLTERYKDEARPLLDGDLKGFLQGTTPEPDQGILMHTPGYPVLLAAVYKVSGDSDAAVRLFQILADAGAAVLVFLIAAELLPVAAAAIAGLLVAFSPQFAYNSLVLLPDSVSALPILLAVYLIARAAKRPRLVTIIAAGAAIGLSCWLRANALLLAPFLVLLMLLLFERGRRWRYAGALVAAAVLVMAPITIRNAVVYGSFIPLSLSAGQNLTAGIADYDPEKRFGFEAYDDATCRQEALLYNRPDYAEDLYRPDGIWRDRARTARALAVIRSNKLWFLGVMLRRAALMLENEKVPVVSVEPTVSNSLEITGETELAWASSPAELMASNTSSASGRAQLSLAENDGALRVAGDDSPQAAQFVSATINVRPKSDYVLRLPVRAEQGRMVIRVESVDGRATLASAGVPDSLERDAPKEGSLSVLQLPFVNASDDQIRVVLANADSGQARAAVLVGRAELFRLGPASYLWTRYPRTLVKAVQKFFKTAWLLPLALIGIALLALARRGRALALVLAVPAYYLSAHSPMHVEPRYVLVVHYFFSILVATTLYWFGARVWKAARAVVAMASRRKARSS
ncbi:MAG TPA: glycosyltransferase family 39 protein, partial [Pyrinomonadaceae bacterium]|nr:glycosyltransferase family 39 protein [Pyrinomonadaceae bacterium]